MRATLEPVNGRLAARRRDPAAPEHLDDIVAQGAAATETGRIAGPLALNTAFCAGLGRARRNPVSAAT